VSGQVGGGRNAETAIDFLVPLQKGTEGIEIGAEKALYLKSGETKEDCPGSASAPAAKPGYLCIYAETEEAPAGITVVRKVEKASGGGGASPTGAVVDLELQGKPVSGSLRFRGSWAVEG